MKDSVGSVGPCLNTLTITSVMTVDVVLCKDHLYLKTRLREFSNIVWD